MNMKDGNIPSGESNIFNETIVDYIISLIHLYGLVHKDKVVGIFNLQNKEKIDIMTINDIMENPPGDLTKNFAQTRGRILCLTLQNK